MQAVLDRDPALGSRPPSESDSVTTSAPGTTETTTPPHLLEDVAEMVGGLWERLSQAVGDISAVSSRVAARAGEFQDLNRAADSMTTSNAEIEEAARVANQISASVQEQARTAQGAMGSSAQRIRALVESVQRVEQRLGRLQETLQQVANVSAEIGQIANQTRMLALNATIEAARAGDAGKGFGVVAGEVKALAQQTSNATTHINEAVSELGSLIGAIAEDSRVNLDNAAAVEAATGELEDTLDDLITQYDLVSEHVVTIDGDAGKNLDECRTVASTVAALTTQVEVDSRDLHHASGRTAEVMDLSQRLMAVLIGAGVETADSPYVRLCQETARRVERLFEDALERGQITLDALFDENYRPIPKTNPQQFTARFTDFTDRVLPDVQEALLRDHPKVAFCAAFDRNAYLPTHNRKYSQPQGPDPVWNAANCRNRRIFDDPVGLGAARNTDPFVLRTYQRDMGGGVTVLMKDVAAPVFVKGRHWGAFRMGYAVE